MQVTTNAMLPALISFHSIHISFSLYSSVFIVRRIVTCSHCTYNIIDFNYRQIQMTNAILSVTLNLFKYARFLSCFWKISIRKLKYGYNTRHSIAVTASDNQTDTQISSTHSLARSLSHTHKPSSIYNLIRGVSYRVVLRFSSTTSELQIFSVGGVFVARCIKIANVPSKYSFHHSGW